MPISRSVSEKIRKSTRKLACQVVLLDHTTFSKTFDSKDVKGKELVNSVCDHLGLIDDRDLFGLQYTAWEDGELNWLDVNQEIRAQRSKPYHFQFTVRFFPKFPRKVDQKARKLVCLQIKDLLSRGKYLIPVPMKQHALLDGLFTQLWIGDYSPKHQKGYIQDKLDRFFVSPCALNSDEEVSESKYESLVHQHHRKHLGMTCEDASVAYMEHASDLLKFYGVSTHAGATDKENNHVLLGVYERGILVYDLNEFREPSSLILEITWQEVVATQNQNRKLHVVFYNDVKKDGGTFCYRFHGLGGVQCAKRLHKQCAAYKEFYHRPEKMLNRCSRSFAEADSIVRASGNLEEVPAKYATTGREIKRAKSSFGRLKTSIRKKLPRKRKGQEPEPFSHAQDSPKKSTITYV